MKTKVLGVAVAHPSPALAIGASRLAKKTAKLAGLSPSAATRAAERLSVTGRYVGGGYGHPTHAGQAAIVDAKTIGLVVDPTYTAKAFACALALSRERDERVLYWHTLGEAADGGLSGEEGELPPALARLLRR
jgi:1-aminocyclopropane-1-carboxylate deaminase/D-cysteine desulfhydrase-like pyridoxal-dependent ACC family enzyme